MAAAVHDKFVERLIERTATITIGDPLDPATDFGPVISAEAEMRILRYIEAGQAEGATLAYGGGRPAGPRFEKNYLQLNSIAAGPTLESSYFGASAANLSQRRPGHRNFPVDGRGVVFILNCASVAEAKALSRAASSPVSPA